MTRNTAIKIAAEMDKRFGLDDTAAQTAITQQADESAKTLIAEGWQGDGSTYDVGAYHGDVDALAARLGGKPDRKERGALEACIRIHLDAAASEAA